MAAAAPTVANRRVTLARTGPLMEYFINSPPSWLILHWALLVL
jgi:hypothetical protein